MFSPARNYPVTVFAPDANKTAGFNLQPFMFVPLYGDKNMAGFLVPATKNHAGA
jgi:hypothetical protein